jgi:decaprenylphospho-beta-D-erythro-pentofuranosid-2-ulose 2-reductase
MRHVILVGATDGIGLALARAYLERSWRVGLLGRDPAKVEDVVATLSGGYPGATVIGSVLDTADRDAALPALEGMLVALGQMDLLVYCAGIMGEEPAEARHVFDVNVLGAIVALEWGADYFVQAGRGRLAAIGSVAGDRGRKGKPVYAATKAALHTWLQGLRHRLHGTGVGVTTVKPGWVRTRMLGDVPGFPPSISPARAAAVIAGALDAGRATVYVPWWWEVVSAALRLLPGPVFNRVAPP